MTTIKTKTDAARYLYSCGDRGASFLGNVVQTRHRKPGTRLRRLAKLHQAGHRVCCAPYDMGTLWVDGQTLAWEDLDDLTAKDPAASLRRLRS